MSRVKFDLNDIAAGYITRQRWTAKDHWVRGPDDAHPALVDHDLWDRAQSRIAVRSHERQKATRSPRATTTPYMLRGLIHCSLCERKMVGTKAHGSLRYRCMAPQTGHCPPTSQTSPRPSMSARTPS